MMTTSLLTPPIREVASLTFHIGDLLIHTLLQWYFQIQRFVLPRQNFERQRVETCDSLPHSQCALDSIHIVPRVFAVIIPRPPRLNILSFVYSGRNAIAPIQYRFNNPLELKAKRQAFTFNGLGQFWDSTFGMLMEWVFDLTDLIPYVGSPNHLPPMPHFDPSTWTIRI